MTLRARTSHLAPAIIVLLVASCGGTREEAKGPGDVALPITIEHEPCDTASASAQKVDSNGDGKPDIVRVMSGARETCRMLDLNHDGRPDAYIYFDANGAVRRTESDFDRDGVTDEIAHFSGGVVVRKDRETNLDKKFDTWDFYEGGKLVRRLRDSDANGRVDQWWTWPNPDRTECAVIASDHGGDGQPDLDSVVDVCSIASDAGPPGAALQAAPPSAAADAGAVEAAAKPAAAEPQTDAGAADAGVKKAKKKASK